MSGEKYYLNLLDGQLRHFETHLPLVEITVPVCCQPHNLLTIVTV